MADNDHSAHDSSKKPVEGCPLCDAEIKRPIKRRFGLGSSDVVVPRTEPENKDVENGKR